MITYREVKSSPSGWPEENTGMSFESELTELIDTYRNVANKHGVSRSLSGAADIVEKDEGWIYDETHLPPEPEAEDATLVSLTPATAVVGSAILPVAAGGTGFTAESVVVVNGADVPTTFVSETELTAQIDPTAAVAGDVPVFVSSPDGDTESLNFTFTAA